MNEKVTIQRTETHEIALSDIKIGDLIEFEPGTAKWKVLDFRDSGALIWKCTDIGDRVFNENGSNVYEGSGIQRYLREKFPDTVPERLKEAVTDEGFFLLTVDEILRYMPDRYSRIATDEEGYIAYWWTASPNDGYGNYARIVHLTGAVTSDDATNANGVAPACIIHL